MRRWRERYWPRVVLPLPPRTILPMRRRRPWAWQERIH